MTKFAFVIVLARLAGPQKRYHVRVNGGKFKGYYD